MFFYSPYFYFGSIILQAICALHCIKRGQTQKWLWIIVFLPYIGCLIYFFSEILTGNEVQQVQRGLSTVVNPGGSIRKMEERLRFADTFQNKVLLADAYLDYGQTEKAIAIYEDCLQGVFAENEHVILALIMAYQKVGEWELIPPLVAKVYQLPQFARSRQHIIYAQSLEIIGSPEKAEKEFNLMRARFSNFEARYQYGQFLLRQGRQAEAEKLLRDMLAEKSQLSRRERNFAAPWFNAAAASLKNGANTVSGKAV